MKQLTKYITEKLKIKLTKSKTIADSFISIQMFMQEDQFDESGASYDYFRGVDSRNQTICYVECFDERFGDRFMLVIFNDDVYLDMVNQYKLEEIEDLGWNEAPEELVEIVQDKLDTKLPVYISGAGLWYDTRYNYIELQRFEKFIDKVYNELK